MEDIAKYFLQYSNNLNCKVIVVNLEYSNDSNPISNSIRIITKEKLFEEIRPKFLELPLPHLIENKDHLIFNFHDF